MDTNICHTSTVLDPHAGLIICTDCSGQHAVPHIPAHVDRGPDIGWDAGANSVLQLDGNVRATWSVLETTVGIACGLAAVPRPHVDDPTSIQFGWYTFALNGALLAQPIERGVLQSTPQPITDTSALKIERAWGVVSYLIGSTTEYTSARFGDGLALLGCSLYSSGDQIPNRPTFENFVPSTSPPSPVISHPAGPMLGRLPLTGRATTGTGMRGQLPLSGHAFSVGIAPMASVAVGIMLFTGHASGKRTLRRGMTATLPLTGRAGTGFCARGRMPLTGRAASLAPAVLDNYIIALETPGYLVAKVGYPDEFVAESVTLAPALTTHEIAQLFEGIRLHGLAPSIIQTLATIRETTDFGEQVHLIFQNLVAEGLRLDGVVTPTPIMIEAVREALTLLDGIGSSLAARNAVAAALATNDVLSVVAQEIIEDQAAFNAALSQQIDVRMLMVDGVTLAAAATYGLRVSMLVSEDFTLDDSADTLVQALERIDETLGVAVTIKLGDDVYTAWVVNTKNRAFTQYDNYPFNSFDSDDRGDAYGCAADGIYLLNGSDDDGAAIKAKLRTCLTNFGTGKMKRFDALYMGYAASKPIAVKVITTSPEGEKVENWYVAPARHASVMRDGRVKFGHGMKAVYWEFEIDNTEGGTMAFDDLKLLPMILDRRIGGDNG
jgi:hypothetical protein